eukprot:s1324_g8.t1
MQAKAGVMEIQDSESEDEDGDEMPDLRHAPTLRLDDCHAPETANPGVAQSKAAGAVATKASETEAEVWKDKYQELLSRLEKLEAGKRQQDAFTTPTPKRPFSPVSKAPSSESLCPSPSPPPVATMSLPKVPPPSAKGLPCVPPPPDLAVAMPVPKPPCPTKDPAGDKAASSSDDVSTAAPGSGGLKAGEEELAEQVDLSHEDWSMAEFQKQVLYIKEQQRMKEEEVEGGWYTEERMTKDLSYSSPLGCTLSMRFKYDESQTEYFVQTADTVKVQTAVEDQTLSLAPVPPFPENLDVVGALNWGCSP